MPKSPEEILWICCKCTHFWSHSLYVICINCHHNRGPCCSYEYTGKPGRFSVQHARESIRPLPPPQQREASLPLTTRSHDDVPPQKVDDRASLGSTTPSQHTSSRVVATGKHARSQALLGVHSDEDGDCFTVVHQMPEVVIQQAGVNAKVELGHPNDEYPLPDEVMRMIIAPQVETLEPTEVAFISSSISQKKSIERCLGGTGRIGWPIQPSICTPPAASPTDGEAANEEPQVAAGHPVPSTGTWSVQIGPPPNLKEAPRKQWLLQNPDWPYRHAGPGDCATLSQVQCLEKNDTAANSQARDVKLSHNDGPDDLDPTICPISAGPVVCDGLDTTGREISELLIQKLYRALFFHPNGCFRTCGRSQAGQNARPVASNGQNPTARNKRRLEDGQGGARNGSGDDESNSPRVKRSRVKPRTSDGPLREFACPVSKGNPDHGYEARCIGWSNSSVEHVLRRHLEIHMATDMVGHLPKAKYDRVNEIKSKYNMKDPHEAEKLWIDAYMVIHDEQDRRNVPSPYLSREDFPVNSHRAAFFLRTEGLIHQNPELAIQMRAYVAELDDLDRQIDSRRRRLREQYREQEARLVLDNRNRLGAAEAQLDRYSDEMHHRLNLRFGSVFAPAMEYSNDPSHHTSHEGFGTSAGDTQSWFRSPGLSPSNQGRLAPGLHASGHVSGELDTFRTRVTSPANLETQPGINYGPFDAGNLHEPPFPPALPSMTRYGIEDEAILDGFAGRMSPSNMIGEIHAVEVSAGALPSFPDAPMPTTVPPIDGAGDGPDSQLLSPGSRLAISHRICRSCKIAVFDGKEICDFCAGWLNNDSVLFQQ